KERIASGRTGRFRILSGGYIRAAKRPGLTGADVGSRQFGLDPAARGTFLDGMQEQPTTPPARQLWPFAAGVAAAVAAVLLVWAYPAAAYPWLKAIHIIAVIAWME